MILNGNNEIMSNYVLLPEVVCRRSCTISSRQQELLAVVA
jgi:hypothetical protein